MRAIRRHTMAVIVRHADPVAGRWLVLEGEPTEAPVVVDLAALEPGSRRVDGATLAGDDLRAVTVGVLRVRPRAASEGALWIDVTAAAPHAEAARVRIDGGKAAITLSAPGVLVALRRSDGRETRAAVDDELIARLDLAALATAGDELWELWLDTPPGERLRVARRRDGLPGKRRIVAYPAVGAGGREARLRLADDAPLDVEAGAARPATPAAAAAGGRRGVAGGGPRPPPP